MEESNKLHKIIEVLVRLDNEDSQAFLECIDRIESATEEAVQEYYYKDYYGNGAKKVVVRVEENIR